MSFKYGLNLRQPQKKQPAKPPIPKALGFGDEDDNDVEKDISRQAYKNKSLKDVSTFSTHFGQALSSILYFKLLPSPSSSTKS